MTEETSDEELNLDLFYTNLDYDIKSFVYNGTKVDMYLSNASSTDYDLTGQVRSFFTVMQSHLL